MTDAEHDAFMRGFDLAQPPGSEEADALGRAEEVAPADPGQLRVAVPKPLGKKFLAIVDALPDELTRAAWGGFLRGLVAQAGGAPVHVHHGGTA